jgi:hypothetical protein
MKHVKLVSICVLSVFCLVGCTDMGDQPLTGIQGQVYSIATPGPTPVGWIPPPLEQVSTILVLSSNREIIVQSTTDGKGRFTIAVSAGTYFLRVKESRIQAETGPYVVRAGEMISVRADYDNGMR